MWFAALLACRPSDPAPPAPTSGGPTPEADPADRVRAELEALGFDVAEGRAEELDTSQCCSWESCYLLNPDNQYLGWWMPPGPAQTAPNPTQIDDGTAIAWRLRPDEAVVAIGRTPPPASYFSFRSYLHDRWFPELGQRDWVFENLGDSLNNFVIATGEGGPFDADFVLVTTAHAGTDAAIRQAVGRAGLDPAIVNTDVVAGEGLVLGLHDEADTFRLQGRIALFEDEDRGREWLADPTIRVLRVTPRVEADPDPLEAPPLRPRGTGTTEEAWRSAFEELGAAITAAHADYAPFVLPTVITAEEDGDCPPGCNRDTFFAVSVHYLLPDWADAFVMVYGVNHERTGKSVYSNFSVVEVEQLSSYAAVHSRSMPGSARVYLPDHPLADDLYAWRVARTCDPTDPYCIAVPLECPGIPSLTQGSIAFRGYTEAATASGPISSELVVDQAVLFTRPAESAP